MIYSECGKVLAQLPSEVVDATWPGSFQVQGGWGPGQPDLVGGRPVQAGDWNKVIVKVPSELSHSMIL